MKFPRLCDLCIDHEYYNAEASERLAVQLVPSAESARLIRNNRMVVRKNNNVFSLYGDVFNTENEFESEFKLSFALIVSDPYFFDASNLKRPEEVDSGGTQTALREGNSKTVYYFHNHRTELIDSKAYLSNARNVGQGDLVLLYPTAFTMKGLEEISDVKLSKPDIDIVRDETYTPYEYRVAVDPQDETKARRIFEVNLTPVGSGHYAFSYKETSEKALFYLNDEFYSLRPFAVIDLFFSNDIASDYKPLTEDKKRPKTFHLSIPARRCPWRYRVIRKFNEYDNLEISSELQNQPFDENDVGTPANGEFIFESKIAWPLKQVLETALDLNGTYVETLGIDYDDGGAGGDDGAGGDGGAGGNGAAGGDGGGEGEEDADDGDGTPQHFRGKICRLPNPTIENLVLRDVKDDMKYYCDVFVYI